MRTRRSRLDGDIFLRLGGRKFSPFDAGEIFPLETRAPAIAAFYAIGTAIGGIAAPLLFGILIAKHSSWMIASGYMVTAALMLAAALIEPLCGIDSEGRSLEQIASPLSSQ
jgi:MFS family permease